jgi:arylsulfatase
VTQQPVEGVSLRYTFGDAHAADRRRTQYFEMCGNRGIYHEGWMAVTRHGIPWQMVPDAGKRFSDDAWELYHLDRDWTQARDLAALHPGRLRELQDLFLIEASKYHVFPLDPRVTERENPTLAGRIDLLGARQRVTYPAGMRRLTEETTLNVKNRSHSIAADVEVPGGAGGVIIAQGGRFGGWSLYCLDGRVHYDYNYFDLEHYPVRSPEALAPGRHDVRVEFHYDGGGYGKGGTVVISVDGGKQAEGRVERTIPYYFSFDETLDVGVDLGTPVTDDYPAVDNAFTGTVHAVRIELDGPAPAADPVAADGRERRVLTSQ